MNLSTLEGFIGSLYVTIILFTGISRADSGVDLNSTSPVYVNLPKFKLNHFFIQKHFMHKFVILFEINF
jgi:hypothetical protein